jgi:hypothetical protein
MERSHVGPFFCFRYNQSWLEGDWLQLFGLLGQ